MSKPDPKAKSGATLWCPICAAKKPPTHVALQPRLVTKETDTPCPEAERLGAPYWSYWCPCCNWLENHDAPPRKP